MTFKFLHTADWHIGRTFRAFDERLAGLLEESRYESIDRLAAVARSEGIRHVLVAGDVFDSERLAYHQAWPAIERMAGHGGVFWHLLPGNHDPARPGGLWERLGQRNLPTNLEVYLEACPRQICDGIFLLPAPLTSRAQSNDPTAWMDHAATPEGALRIGLAHGSIRDFTAADMQTDSAGEAFAHPTGAIHPGRAKTADLAYLALGDWHAGVRVNERTWYPGTPEADRFRPACPGEALVVTLAGSAPADVSPIGVGHFVWHGEDVRITPDTDLAQLERRLVGLASAPNRLLLRLSFTGALSASGRSSLDAWCANIAARIRYLEADSSQIQLLRDEADLEALQDDARLAAAALRLRQLAEDPSDPRHRSALVALQRLVEIAGDIREGQSP